MHLRQLLVALFTAALAAHTVHAQGPADPIGRNLFPPEFIMNNADAINLTDAQKQSLHETMQQRQEQFGELQQALQRETEALGKLLAEPSANETSVLAQFDKLQDREREIKRAQLSLM